MSKKRKDRDDFPGNLFPFQRSIVEKAISKRCAAIFADTGLGKTRMLLCWLEVILRGQPGAMGLIVTPLSTGRQLVDEALGMGLNAIVEKRAMMPRDSDLDDPKYEGRALIAVTNYERLKNFELSKFFAVALDESGVLKDAGSVTASLLVSGCAAVPYRLSLRAPPSPDDLDELINQAVFLGYGTRESIVSKHINAAGRRFSLIDEQAFFEFVCEWSCWIRKPSDIGFDSDDARYELPGIDYTSVVVPSPGGLVESYFHTAADLSLSYGHCCSSLSHQRREKHKAGKAGGAAGRPGVEDQGGVRPDGRERQPHDRVVPGERRIRAACEADRGRGGAVRGLLGAQEGGDPDGIHRGQSVQRGAHQGAGVQDVHLRARRQPAAGAPPDLLYHHRERHHLLPVSPPVPPVRPDAARRGLRGGERGGGGRAQGAAGQAGGARVIVGQADRACPVVVGGVDSKIENNFETHFFAPCSMCGSVDKKFWQ